MWNPVDFRGSWQKGRSLSSDTNIGYPKGQQLCDWPACILDLSLPFLWSLPWVFFYSPHVKYVQGRSQYPQEISSMTSPLDTKICREPGSWYLEAECGCDLSGSFSIVDISGYCCATYFWDLQGSCPSCGHLWNLDMPAPPAWLSWVLLHWPPALELGILWYFLVPCIMG